MSRTFICLFLLVSLVGCVTVPRPDATDFNRMVDYEALGLTLKLPFGFTRFNEPPAVAFRPDPPTRTSPGVLIIRYQDRTPARVLRDAKHKVLHEMYGDPLVVRGDLAGREVAGIHAELITHFIWLYVLSGEDCVWLVQIIAPVTWPDEQVISFHDMVCNHIHIQSAPGS